MTIAPNKHNITVWLSYVGYPVTTAAYIERALRKLCRTVTVGPPMPQELIKLWQLQNMKLPPVEHDVVTGFTSDMGELLLERPNLGKPDFYLWVESVPGHIPGNISALGCPTACYLIDSHLSLDRHLAIIRDFNYVFIAQREYLEVFRSVNPRTYWLPLACDPEVHRRWDVVRHHDISFVGGVSQGSRREGLLDTLNSEIPVQYERCFWDDMARLFSCSRLVFNNAVKNDLNMRVFEVMSTGTMLLTDLARQSGQDVLFVDGEDYACYDDGNLVDLARFYLENEALRERIARRGQRLVHNAHTYRHRVEDMLAVVLDGKADTFSAGELRARSVAGVPSLHDELRGDIQVGGAVRSFVIPVLDYSPASEYNILTLLDDLKDIDGEVVVVFNGAAVGEELKRHPRITRHAIMKQNVGVARGWNVGLAMAGAETVFILNADLHLSNASIASLEDSLVSLPHAACVGPQGAFVDYRLCRDFHFFEQGSFAHPLEVDAVSGFFFAVNRRLFAENGLQFENDLTPCYFEEWDIGLQIKKAGLKNYIVPTAAYAHHWSGTIRALHSIPYMGKDEAAGDILLRNRALFLAKWRRIVHEQQRPDLLVGGWKRYMGTVARELLTTGRHEQAREVVRQLVNQYPEDFTVAALARCVALI
jgi:hypothetical protein